MEKVLGKGSYMQGEVCACTNPDEAILQRRLQWYIATKLPSTATTALTQLLQFQFNSLYSTFNFTLPSPSGYESAVHLVGMSWYNIYIRTYIQTYS